MVQQFSSPGSGRSIERRKLLRNMGVAVGAAVLAPRLVHAQAGSKAPGAPPSTITQPPRDFSANGAPTTSPDFKKLYVISTGQGPGDTGAGGKGDMHAFGVGSDNRLSNGKLFSNFMVDGVKCGPDGVRADVDGNLWCSSNAGRAVGYSGVTVWTPQGQLIGRIRLPEICGNVCFGGPKRNRLFMAASQSLYAVYTGTQGAAPG